MKKQVQKQEEEKEQSGQEKNQDGKEKNCRMQVRKDRKIKLSLAN